MQHRAFVRFLTRNDDMHETFKNLVEKNESIQLMPQETSPKESAFYVFKESVHYGFSRKKNISFVYLFNNKAAMKDFTQSDIILKTIAVSLLSQKDAKDFQFFFQTCSVDGKIYDYLARDNQYNKSSHLITDLDTLGVLFSRPFDTKEQFKELLVEAEALGMSPDRSLPGLRSTNQDTEEANQKRRHARKKRPDEHRFYRFSWARRADNPLKTVDNFLHVYVLRTDNTNRSDNSIAAFSQALNQIALKRKCVPLSVNPLTQSLINTDIIIPVLYVDVGSQTLDNLNIQSNMLKNLVENVLQPVNQLHNNIFSPETSMFSLQNAQKQSNLFTVKDKFLNSTQNSQISQNDEQNQISISSFTADPRTRQESSMFTYNSMLMNTALNGTQITNNQLHSHALQSILEEKDLNDEMIRFKEMNFVQSFEMQLKMFLNIIYLSKDQMKAVFRQNQNEEEALKKARNEEIEMRDQVILYREMINKLKNYQVKVKEAEVFEMLKNGIPIEQIREDYNVDQILSLI